MRTETGEERGDGIAVTDDDPVDTAHLSRLGHNSETAGRTREGQGCLGTGAGHLECARASRLGERAVGQEGAAPGSLRVAQRSVDDGGGEAPSRASTRIDQTGLTGQLLAVGVDTDEIPVALAEPTGMHDRHLAGVSEDLGDVLAETPRCDGRVEIGLDDDLAAHDVQTGREAKHGRHLCLAAARFGDLEPCKLVLHRCGHRHVAHLATCVNNRRGEVSQLR